VGRTDPWRIPIGAKIFIGAPAQATDPQLLEVLLDVASKTPSADEAHLPLCFILGVTPAPIKVLVLIGRSLKALERDVPEVGAKLEQALGPNEYLDVWPMARRNSMAEAVRKADCRIFSRMPPHTSLAARCLRFLRMVAQNLWNRSGGG
jgi:hypothetical protein